MLKSEAAAYLAGVTQTEGAEASAPTNLHVITGEVGEASADGKTLVKIDGLMFSESDDQFIEVDALGGLEEGDIATIVLTGEQGHAMTPLALGSIGSVDRITVRIAAIEADYIKVEQLDAAKARIGELEADHVSVDDFNAATGRIGTLETTRATITDLNAATARIGTLEADHVSTDDFSAATARIGTLETNTADIGTIRANSAKVQNLTAAELEADHATVGSLSTNYAHITNGVIDNATIGYADVNNLSAHYAEIQNGKINSALIDTAAIVDEQVFTVTGNKATLAQIDASKINVLNLKAQNIEVERINGQTVTNKTLVDALTQHESDISDLDSKIDDEVEALNERIDGAIETFTGTVVPTLNNTPASQWNTVALKDQHVGDVYYVVNSQSAQNGYCYRFTKSGSTYSWQLIKDSDVTAALSRLQTAEGKIGDIEQFDVTVGSFMTDTDDELSSLKTRTTSLETSIGDKVDTSTFNTVSQKVDTNEANITSMSTVLTNNGLTSSTNITNTVNTVKQTADTNKASITNLTQTVNNKADGSTVTTLTNRVSTVEQNLSGITTRVGKTEQSLESVANPNLTPYFSADPTDVYNATTNPHGYWHVAMNAVSGNWTQLEDGWARLSKDNSSGTGSAYGNVRTEQISTLKPNTDYTLMVEARNVTVSGTVYLKGIALRSGTGQFASTPSQTLTTVSSAVFYQHAKTVADLSSCKESTSGYIQINAGASITGDFRFSLYESAVVDINGTQTVIPYDGPYKPYVEQTLIARMRSAETSIEQNSDAIALRATKTEAEQMAQPNLSPFFSQYKSDVYSSANPDGYWHQSSADGFPSLISVWDFEQETVNGGGWAHFVANNTGTVTLYAHAYIHKNALQLKPSTKYTFLVEWLDVSSTGGTPVLYTTTQHGGTNGANNDYFTTTTSVSLTSGSGSKYISATTRNTLDSGCNNRIRAHIWIGTGISTSGYIRISLYEGEYTGPYKPYSGAQLYASQAELKVANDNINLKVSKNDVINQINVSTEGAKIQASKVEIDGTAVFNAAKSKLDAAYDAKGAAATVQNNLNNLEIGGRNLLLATGTTQSKTMPAVAAGSYTTWDPYKLVGAYNTLGLSAGDSITISFDWSVTGAAANTTIKIGTNADPWEYFGILVTFAAGASSGHVTKTYTVSSKLASCAGTNLRARIDAVGTAITTSMVLTLSNVKLEKGNKATDWTPAPEDTVKRTQRIWYRTNGSSAPSTPGTASSNWVTKSDDGNDAWTKMHIAINSTHKYIYTCEQYEMANGTVGYTSVLLDNTITVIDGGNIITGSVTANKLNAASINASNTLTVGAMTDAAASMILNSNVQVGGRNLLGKTDNPTVPTGGNAESKMTFGDIGRYNNPQAEFSIDDYDDSARSIVITSSRTGNCGVSWYTKAGEVQAGTSYTFSCRVKSSVAVSVHTHTAWRNGSATAGYTGWTSAGSVSISANTWTDYSCTFTPSSFARLEWEFLVAICFTGSSSGVTFHVAHAKLEKGNKATDWTPAPEDMATAESLAGTNESLDGAIADIGELSDQLVGTISEQNKTITTIQTYLNSLRQDLDAEIQSRQQWLNFDAAEGLVIGAKNSAFKTVTTNTSQQFKNGGTVLAETSGMEFVAPVMRSDQILIGNWMWTRRDNGNLSLKWIG